MPPMTMVFQVSDPAMLERVKAGDKVRFTATGEGGKYTLTDIQAVQ
jgi:Cu/Ag efflux protein CusF